MGNNVQSYNNKEESKDNSSEQSHGSNETERSMDHWMGKDEIIRMGDEEMDDSLDAIDIHEFMFKHLHTRLSPILPHPTPISFRLFYLGMFQTCSVQRR